MCVDWSAMAPQWNSRREDVERMKADLTDRLLADLAPLAGRRILELGAGTGELAARLAAAAGPDGSVLASDAADGMVALLDDRLRGIPNADTARLDALQIALPSDSVDVVVFRMGLMLLTEPDVALRDIRRVLTPGGAAGIAVWGAPQSNPWMLTVGMAAMMHGLVQGGPPVGPGGPFSLADPVELEKRMRGAGFTDIEVTVVDSVMHYADMDEHLAMLQALSPQLSAAVGGASAEQAAAVRTSLTDLTAQYRSDDGLRLPWQALLCIAR